MTALLLATFGIWNMQVQGAAYYWDNDGSAIGNNVSGSNLGLSGTWNTSLLNWWDGSASSLIAWPNSSLDTAIFKGTAGRLTLGSNISAGTLQFDAANYTINNSIFGLTLQSGIAANESATIQSGVGGSLILGANSIWNVAATKTLTVSSLVTDGASSFAIDKQGGGALTLSGANTFDGGVTLTAGTLNISSASALGTGTLTINGGTIDNTSGAALTLSTNNVQTWGADIAFTGTSSFNLGTGAVTLGANRLVTVSANTLTVGGAITDGASSFALTKDGAGTLVLSGNNTVDGALTLSLGTLTLSGTNTFSGVTVTAGTLNLNNAGALGSGPLAINGTTTLNNTSGAAVTLSTNNTQTWGGDLTFTGTSSLNLGTGAVTLGANRQITVSGSTLTVGGAIGDSGGGFSLAKVGTGTLVLSGNNTYSGGTTISAGTLVANHSSALGSTGNITFGGGTLQYAAGSTTDISARIKNSTAGAIAINTSSQTVTFAGAIDNTNTGGLTKTGNGTLKLSAANTYTGNTAISAGTLTITNNTALAAGAVSVAGTTTAGVSGGRLVLGGTLSSGLTFANNLTLAGSGGGVGGINTASTGALVSVGNNSLTGTLATSATSGQDARIASTFGTLTLNSSAITLGAGRTTTFDGPGVIVQGATAFNAAGTTSAAIDKRGSGTLVLTNSGNLFSGIVNITGGFLRVSNAGALGTSVAATAISPNSGTLEVRTDSTNVGSFSTKNISLVSGNGTVFVGSTVGGTGANNLNQTVDFGAFVFGAVSRTLTLNGRNGYGFSIGTVGTNMGGNGNNNVAFTTNANGLATLDGNVTIGDSTGNRNFTITATGDAVFNGGVLISSSGVPTFSKGGTGTLTWNTAAVGNASTITGAATINAGTLAVSNFANSFATLSQINIGNATTTGGILSWIGTADELSSKAINLNTTTANPAIFSNSSTNNKLTLTGTFTGVAGTKTIGLILGGSSTGDNTITSVIPANATALAKIGTGTWLLNPASVELYTGATTVAAGTLKVSATAGNSSDIIPNGSAVIFNTEPFTTAGTNAAGSTTAGGTLNYVNNAGGAATETMGALTATAGAGKILITPNANTTTLTFASLGTRTAGATLDLTTGTGTVGFTASVTGTGGIFNGATTLNGVDWVAAGTGPFTAVAPTYTTLVAASSASGTNFQLTTGTVNLSTASPAVNSLKLAGSAGTTAVTFTGTMTNATGGLLFDNTLGDATLGGGTQFGAAATEVIVITGGSGSGTLTINSPIASTTGQLTKSGAGTLILTGASAFTGNVNINEGTVQLSGGTARIGTSQAAATVFNLRQNATFDLNGAGTSATITIGGLNGAGTITNSGGGSSTASTLVIGNGATTTVATSVFGGTLQNGAGPSLLNVTKDGTGVQYFTGPNSYTGVTTITRGTLAVTSLANGLSNSGIGASTNVAGNLVLNGGTLLYTGSNGIIMQNTQTPSVSTDRLFTITASGGTIDSSGTFGNSVLATGVANNATLVFSGTGDIAFTGSGNRTLTLQGTSTGDNTFTPHLIDPVSQVSPVVTGTLALTKAGAGLWILNPSTSNTYSGATTVNGSAATTAGVLQFADESGSVKGIPTSSNIILGSATGPGVLQTSGSFTRATGTTANSGQLSIGASGGGFAASISKLTVNLGNAGAALVLGTAPTANSLLVLSSSTALAEVELVNGLDLGNAARTIQVDDNANTSTDYAIISGKITGIAGGTLTKTGAGNLVLTNATSDYVANTQVSAGALTLTSIDGAGGGSNLGTNAGTLILGANSTTTAVTLNYVGAGETTTRSIQLNQNTSGITIDSSGYGALVLNGTWSNAGTAGAKTLTLLGANADLNTISGSLTDNGAGALSISKQGGGTWVLSGANTFTGNVSATNGILGVGADSTGTAGAVTSGPLGRGTLNLGTNSTGQGGFMAVGADRTILNNVSQTAGSTGGGTYFMGDYSLTFNGTFAATNGNSATLTNNITAPGKTVTFNGATTFGESGGTTARTLTINGGGVTILNGDITNLANAANALTYSGTGTLTLTGNNSFTGATTLTSGTLNFGSLSNLGGGTVITMNGGTLQWRTGTSTDISTRTVTFATAASTYDTNGNDVTLANSIGNAGAFGMTKTGAGTLYLKGANNFTGTVTINGGVVKIDNELNLGVVANDVTFGAGGGTLQVTSGFTADVGKVISVQAGPGTIQVDSGTLAIGSAIVGTSAATANGGGLIKTGAGTLALTVSNSSYDAQGVGLGGATGVGFRVDAGTLLLQGTSNSVVGDINPTSMTMQLNGGNLSIQTDTASIARANLWVSSNATVTTDRATTGGDLTQAIGTGTGAQLTIGNTTPGTPITLTVAGGSNFTSGTATVSFGATTLNAPVTFNVTNPASATTLLSIGAVTTSTANAITLTGNGNFAGTGIIGGTGGTVNLGVAGAATAFSGTATFTGANTFTGGVFVNSGTALANVSNATTVSGAFGPSASAVRLGDSTGSNNASVLANSFTVSNPINVISGSSGNTLTLGNNGTTTAAIFSGAITLANNLTVTTTGTTGSTTLSTGGITGTGNLTLNAINTTAGTGITLSGSVNPTGTVTNSGASGAGATVISGVIGANVTGVVQDSTVSSLTLGGVTNLWSSGLTIRAGTVTGGNNNNTFGANANVITLGHSTGSANATLIASNTGTYQQPITVAAGSSGNTLTIADAAATTGAPTYTGAVTVNNDLTIAKTGNSTGSMTFTGGFTTSSGTGNDITIQNNGSPASGGFIVISGTAVNNAGAITNNGTGSALAGVTISADIGTSVTNLTQSSATSSLTLSGTNIGYTGATTVSNGTLNITGSTGALLTTSSISVAGGATLNLNNTVGQAQNLGSGALSLGVGAGTTTLGFDLGSSTGPNYDSITTSATATTANTVAINVTGLVGFNAGTYNLLTAGGGLSNAGATTYLFNGLGAGTTAGFGFSKSVSETLVSLTATALGTDVYWTGAQADGKWNTLTNSMASNWSTDSAGTLDAGGTPGIGQTVNFVSTAAVAGNPSSIATTLQTSFSVTALRFNTTVGSGPLATVSIAPAGAETLTLNSSGNAILVDNGAPTAINITAPIILAASQTWDIQNSGTTLAASGGVSGSTFGITKAGPGNVTLSGAGVTYTGTTSINVGTLTLSGATAFASAVTFGASSTGVLEIASVTQSIPSLATVDTTNNDAIVRPTTGVDTTLTVNQSGTSVFGGVLADNSAGADVLTLIKNGAGSLTLNNASTYSGGTTLSGGTLVVGNATAMGTAGLTIGTAGVTIASNAAITTTNTVAANADFIVGGSTDLGLGATTLSANRIITFDNTGLTTFASITGAAGRTLTLSGNGNSSIGAITTGAAGTLTKNGTGTATLTAANTYTGTTTINAGTLKTGATNNVFNGTTGTAVVLANANNAATFDLNGTNQAITTLTIGGASGGVSTQGIVNIGSGGTLTLGGTVTTTATGNTTLTHQINGGNLDLGGATRTFAVNDSTGVTNDLSISSVIQATGAFGITKTQAGRLVLTGTNTYSGTTTVTTGQLQFQGSIATSLPAASAISLGGGTLELRNDDSGTLAYNNTVALTATSTIDVGNNGGATTNSIVQLGALTQATASARQLNITGANGYSITLASLALSPGTGATTTLNPTTANLSITGNVTNGMSGFATTNFDTLALAGTATGNSISGIISDAVGGAFLPTLLGGYTKITQSGGSTWRLSGANTNTGAVAVQNGALWLAGGNNRLNANGGSVTLGNAATTGILIIGGNADGTTTAGSQRTQQLNQINSTSILSTAGTATNNRVIGGSDGGTSAGTPANNSVLTLNIGAGFTDTYNGLIGWDGVGSVGFQNNINLDKNGGGNLVLNGDLTNWTGTGSGPTDATRPLLNLNAGVLTLNGTINTAIINYGGLFIDNAVHGPNFSITTLGGLVSFDTASDSFASNSLVAASHGVASLNFQNNTGVVDYAGSDMYLGASGARSYAGTALAAGASNTYRFGGGSPWTQPSTASLTGSGGYLQVANSVAVGATNVIIGDNGTYNSGGSIFGRNSTVEFRASQSYTGTTTLAGGTLVVSNTNQLGVPTTAAGSIILDGGIFRFSGIATDISNRITIDSGGTVDTGGASGTVTFVSAIGNSTTGTSAVGTGGLTKIGAGTLVLTAANTYAGTTTVSGGTLQLNANGGSLATTSGLTFGGGGTFRLDNTGATATLSQSMGALAFTAGDGVILSQRTAAQSTNLTFASLSARTPGATGNFTVGGTGATDAINKVIFTAAPSTGQFIDPGLYFGGTSFAAYNATGYVRALVYGTDTNASTTGAGAGVLTALAGKDAQITGAVTAQTSVAVNSLKLNGAFGIAMSAGQTLTVTSGGIIKTGTTATITGGTLATSGELIIRQDAAADALTIDSVINSGTGVAGNVALTKSGAGTLTLGTSTNAINGQVVINGGTLSIDAQARLTGSTGYTLDGGTFLMTGDASITGPLSLGLNGGTIRLSSGTANRNFGTAGDVVQFVGLGARTLTLNGVDSRLKQFQFNLGDNGGPTSLIIAGAGDATVVGLNGVNTYTGTTTISRGILRLSSTGALPGGIGGATLSTSNTGGGNLIFAATGALPTNNRAVLELNATSGDFYRAVGTGIDQVSWSGHGGFSVSDSTTRIVNLGGAGATLTWGTGGFVPTGSALQFGQSAANVGFAGTVDFQNAIDLGGAARTVDVANGSQTVDAILNGNITGTSGTGGLLKQGLGALRLNGTNNTGTLTVSVTGGTLYFEDSSAVLGASGTITVTHGATSPAAIGLAGSTNPLTFFNSRLAPASNGGFALDVSSSDNLDFSTGNVTNMRLTAFNPANTAVYYTGTITPSGTTYRFGGQTPTAGTASLASTLILSNKNTLTGARSVDLAPGNLTLLQSQNYSNGTVVNTVVAGGNNNVGVGSDASFGSGTVTVGGANTVAFGTVNGDHVIPNRISSIQTGTAALVLGDLTSDGISNNASQGALTFTGTFDLTGRSAAAVIHSRTNHSAIFLGDISGSTNGLTLNNSTSGLFSILSAATNGGVTKGYSGAVSLADNSNLYIDGNGSLGSTASGVTLGSSTLALQPGAGTVTLTGRAITITTDRDPRFVAYAGGNLTLGGAINHGTAGSGRTITKIGAGTLTIQGKNGTWGNTTTQNHTLLIQGGKVALDSTAFTVASDRFLSTDASNLLLTLGAVNGTLGGGGTLELIQVVGNANALTQAFTGTLTVNQGAHTIQVTNNNTTQAANLNLGGTFTRAALNGGTINFVSTTAGGTNTIGSSVANQSTLSILGGAYVFTDSTGVNWATQSGSNTIIPLASYTSGLPASGAVGTTNYLVTTSPSAVTAAESIGSLKFAPSSGTQTITLNAGATITNTSLGLLFDNTSGSGIITSGGTTGQFGVAGSEVIVHTAGTGTVTTNKLTLNGVIKGASTALTKSGSGTLVLAGANTYTGALTINAGTVEYSSATVTSSAGQLGNPTAAAANIVLNGGTLSYTGTTSNTLTFGITINSQSTINVADAGGTLLFNPAAFGITGVASTNTSGVSATTGILQKTGLGTLTIQGGLTNTNLGLQVVTGAVNLAKTGAFLAVGESTNASGIPYAALIVNDGASAKITGAGTDQIGNASSVVVQGTGFLDVNGSGTTSTTESIDGLAGNGIVKNTGASAFTLTLGANNSSGISAYTVGAAQAAALVGDNNINARGLNHFAGVIQDNIALNKIGSGTQILSGNNTYSGATTISAGTLKLGIANALPSGNGKGNITIVGDSTATGVAVGGAANLIAPGTLDMGGFDQAINGLNSTTGGFVTNNPTAGANITSTLTVGSGNASGAFNGVIMDGYSVGANSSTATPLAYVGTINLTKVGTATQTLSGANTYTGTTSINAGTLSVGVITGVNNNLGNATSAVVLGDGSNKGTLSYTGNTATFTRGFTVNAGGGQIDTSTSGQTLTLGTADITSASNGNLTVGGAGNTTITSAIQTGAGGLTKEGAGVLTLTSNSNSYTGSTVVTSGTLQLGSGSSSGSLATTSAISVGTGATFAIKQSDTVVQGTDFSGAAITGAGNFAQTGSGTTVLTAANAYTGSTTVLDGQLQVGVGGVGKTGTGAVTVKTGATIFGTGTVQGSSFTAESGSTIHAGDGTAAGNLGALNFTPVGTGTYDIQSGSTVVLGISTPNNFGSVDPYFGSNAIGSTGYNSYLDSFATGLGAGSHDLLSFSGAAGSSLTFNGTLTVLGSSFTPSLGQIFNLMDWNNLTFTTSISPSSYVLPDISGAGLTWDTSRFTSSGVIAVTPEPSRALLLLLGLFGLFIRRRRK